MRVSYRAATFFPLAASYRFCGDRGAGREQVELGSGLRHEQEGRESRGKMGGRELMEKRRGTNGFIAWQRVGLADEVGSDAIPDAAGGEYGATFGSLGSKLQNFSALPHPSIRDCKSL